MILNAIFGFLALLSLSLLLWQWLAAVRFPLHERSADHRIGAKAGSPEPNPPDRGSALQPPVTLLKPLKGCDASTEDCLRSWFAQDYTGEIQILFGVASADDPVCAVVRKLLEEFPKAAAQLVVCGPSIGANAKVSKLADLGKLAKHEILVISDADVCVPPDLLSNAVTPLREAGVGLVSCFYRLANPATLAMQWEAIAINADFWSQVLQSQSLKPLDFALGAVMVTRRKQLEEIGGFMALADCLADDYQLGNRIVRKGYRIAFCPVVAECWDPSTGWGGVWKHQLRWARTIRVCQPVPYFFSILSNVTLWALVWFVTALGATFSSMTCTGTAKAGVFTASFFWGLLAAPVFVLARTIAAYDLQRRLTRASTHGRYAWIAPIKDLLQAAIWLCAFAGNSIEWRGQRFRLRRDGTLVKI